jgi:hypothetical protein
MRVCVSRNMLHARTTRSRASSYNITHADFCVNVRKTHNTSHYFTPHITNFKPPELGALPSQILGGRNFILRPGYNVQ